MRLWYRAAPVCQSVSPSVCLSVGVRHIKVGGRKLARSDIRFAVGIKLEFKKDFLDIGIERE